MATKQVDPVRQAPGEFGQYLTHHLRNMYGDLERASALKRAYHLANILPHVRGPKDRPILEIGPGYGEMIAILLERGFSGVEAMDISQEVVQHIRQKFPAVPCVQSSNLEDFFASRRGRYQHIIMLDVLEHVPKEDMLPALKTILGALVVGGSVIIQTVNATSPFSENSFYTDITHCWQFSENNVRQLLNTAGFGGIEIRGYRFPAGPVGAIRTLLRKPLHWLYYLGAIINGIVRVRILDPNLVIIGTKTSH